MLERTEGSMQLVTHQLLNGFRVLLGDLPRHVQVLVFLLSQPAQSIGIDQSGAGLIGPIGAAAVPCVTQVKE